MRHNSEINFFRDTQLAWQRGILQVISSRIKMIMKRFPIPTPRETIRNLFMQIAQFDGLSSGSRKRFALALGCPVSCLSALFCVAEIRFLLLKRNSSSVETLLADSVSCRRVVQGLLYSRPRRAYLAAADGKDVHPVALGCSKVISLETTTR